MLPGLHLSAFPENMCENRLKLILWAKQTDYDLDRELMKEMGNRFWDLPSTITQA